MEGEGIDDMNDAKGDAIAAKMDKYTNKDPTLKDLADMIRGIKENQEEAKKDQIKFNENMLKNHNDLSAEVKGLSTKVERISKDVEDIKVKQSSLEVKLDSANSFLLNNSERITKIAELWIIMSDDLVSLNSKIESLDSNNTEIINTLKNMKKIMEILEKSLKTEKDATLKIGGELYKVFGEIEEISGEIKNLETKELTLENKQKRMNELIEEISINLNKLQAFVNITLSWGNQLKNKFIEQDNPPEAQKEYSLSVKIEEGNLVNISEQIIETNKEINRFEDNQDIDNFANDNIKDSNSNQEKTTKKEDSNQNYKN